jgi:hypothetical protein
MTTVRWPHDNFEATELYYLAENPPDAHTYRTPTPAQWFIVRASEAEPTVTFLLTQVADPALKDELKEANHVFGARLVDADAIINFLGFYNAVRKAVGLGHSSFKPVNMAPSLEYTPRPDEDPYVVIAVLEQSNKVMVFRRRRFDDEEYQEEREMLDKMYGLDYPLPSFEPQRWQDGKSMVEYSAKLLKLREKYGLIQDGPKRIDVYRGQSFLEVAPAAKNRWVEADTKKVGHPDVYEGLLYDAYPRTEVFRRLVLSEGEPPLFFASILDVHRVTRFPQKIHTSGQTLVFDPGFGEKGKWVKFVPTSAAAPQAGDGSDESDEETEDLVVDPAGGPSEPGWFKKMLGISGKHNANLKVVEQSTGRKLVVSAFQDEDVEYAYVFRDSSKNLVELLLWVESRKPCIRCRKFFSDSNNAHGACQWHSVHPAWYHAVNEAKLVTLRKFLAEPEKQAELGLTSSWPATMKFSDLYARCVNSKLLRRIREKCQYLESKYGVANADELQDSKNAARYAVFTNGGICFPTGSLLDASLGSLENFTKSQSTRVHSDDPAIRESSRVLRYLLSQRSIQKSIISLDFDPDDPVTVPKDFANVSPHWHHGQVRYTDDTGRTRIVWACCGQARERNNTYAKQNNFRGYDYDQESPPPTPEVPGCYTGRHSATRRDPDLHIQSALGVSSRGTDYVHFEKTTQQLIAELEAEYKKDADSAVAYDLLIEFNSWHGGIPVPTTFRIKDEATEKLYREYIRTPEKPQVMTEFFALNRGHAGENPGFITSRIEQLEYNRGRSEDAFPPGLEARDWRSRIADLDVYYAEVKAGKRKLPGRPREKETESCRQAPKASAGVTEQEVGEFFEDIDKGSAWLKKMRVWAADVRRFNARTARPRLGPAVAQLDSDITTSTTVEDALTAAIQSSLASTKPDQQSIAQWMRSVYPGIRSGGLSFLLSLESVHRDAAGISAILRSLTLAKKDEVEPDFPPWPLTNMPAPAPPPPPNTSDIEEAYTDFEAERNRAEARITQLNTWLLTVTKFSRDPNSPLKSDLQKELREALKDFKSEVSGPRGTVVTAQTWFDDLMSTVAKRVVSEKYHPDDDFMTRRIISYISEDAFLSGQFELYMKGILAALTELILQATRAAELLSDNLNGLGITQTNSGIDPDYPGRPERETGATTGSPGEENPPPPPPPGKVVIPAFQSDGELVAWYMDLDRKLQASRPHLHEGYAATSRWLKDLQRQSQVFPLWRFPGFVTGVTQEDLDIRIATAELVVDGIYDSLNKEFRFPSPYQLERADWQTYAKQVAKGFEGRMSLPLAQDVPEVRVVIDTINTLRKQTTDRSALWLMWGAEPKPSSLPTGADLKNVSSFLVDAAKASGLRLVVELFDKPELVSDIGRTGLADKNVKWSDAERALLQDVDYSIFTIEDVLGRGFSKELSREKVFLLNQKSDFGSHGILELRYNKNRQVIPTNANRTPPKEFFDLMKAKTARSFTPLEIDGNVIKSRVRETPIANATPAQFPTSKLAPLRIQTSSEKVNLHILAQMAWLESLQA